MATATDSEHRSERPRYELGANTAHRVAAWHRRRVAELRRLPVDVRIIMLRDALTADLSIVQCARDRRYLLDLTTDTDT